MSLQLIAELCNGRLKGDNPESSDVTFDPGDINGGNYTVDTQTAGWVWLLHLTFSDLFLIIIPSPPPPPPFPPLSLPPLMQEYSTTFTVSSSMSVIFSH